MLEAQERQIRVFISSTFRDMGAERDYLVKFIFPQLRKLCESRSVTWGEVDLRWGITDEEKAEGKVLPLCLDEIRRCRPYFIGILGERYGWVPQQIPDHLIKDQPWLAQHLNRSVTELEIVHGVLRDAQMHGHAFFYLRDPGFLENIEPENQSDFVAENHEHAEKLKRLKNEIRRACEEQICQLRENYCDPQELGQWILEDFTRLINELFPEAQKLDPLDRETADHEAFAESRARVYIGRREYFDRLDVHAASQDQPLIILGESGSGKSALFANWAARYRAAHPEDFLLVHFIGSTPDSANLAAMLRRIMGEFKRRFGITQEIPDQPDELRATFADWLQRAAAQGKVVLILDALNQLEDRDGSLDLRWLPLVAPANARIFLSTLPGRFLDDLNKRGWRTLQIKPLNNEDRRTLIAEYLTQYTKALDRTRAERIVAAPQTANPLYLRALLEELRIFGSHERLDERITHYLEAGTVAGLYQKILSRWETDYGGSTDLVRNAMTLLWASRRGLSESELLELLGADGLPLPRAEWSPFYLAAEQALVNRSGLLNFFHEFLQEAVEQRYLPGEEEQQAARSAAHQRLATYFHKQDNFLESIESQRTRARSLPPTPRPANRRKAEELAFQRLNVLHATTAARADYDNACKALEDLLADPVYLETKVEAGLIFDLADDLANAAKALPVERPQNYILLLLAEAIHRDIHFIARHVSDYPQIFFQCLWKSCWWYDSQETAKHYIDSGDEVKNGRMPWTREGPKLFKLLEKWRLAKELITPGFVWLRSLRPPIQPLGGAGCRTFACQEQVHCIAISPNGQRVAAGSGVFAHVRVWDMADARLRFSREVGCVVTSIAFSRDGKQIVFAEGNPIQEQGDGDLVVLDASSNAVITYFRLKDDWGESLVFMPDGHGILYTRPWTRKVWIWNLLDGTHQPFYDGHAGYVMSIAISNDGKRAVSASADKTIHIWDVARGTGIASLIRGPRIACLTGHEDRVGSAAFSADGHQVVSGSWDKTVRVWDVQSRKELACLRGHEARVNSVAFSPDGKYIVSGGNDHTVRVWDAAGHTEVSTLRGHTGFVTCVAFSPDGEYILSGSCDNLVKTWKIGSSFNTLHLPDHAHYIRDIVFSPDGKRLATASRDETARIWDGNNGVHLRCLGGHQACVEKVVFSPEGERIATGASGAFSLRIWQVESGTELLKLDGAGIVESIDFSPEGHHIAVLTKGDLWPERTSIWDTTNACKIAHFDCFKAYDIKYSGDGRNLMVRYGNGVVIHDARNGKQLHVTMRHESVFKIPGEQYRWQTNSAAGDDPRLECAVTGRVLAWLRGRVNQHAKHPAGLVWALADDFHLDLVALEGETATPVGSPPVPTHSSGAQTMPVMREQEVSASSAAEATRKHPFVNSLGMKFVPVPGTRVLFSVWDTRVQDYLAYADAEPAVNKGWMEPKFDQGEDHPVVCVSWEDAKAFCAWLTQKERKERKIGADHEYRLPTDREWSAAVGGGRYPWGDQWPPPKGAGNYADQTFHNDPWQKGNPWIKGYDDGYAFTSPVGSFATNQYGLYDMGGNVCQWCEDWYRSEMNEKNLLEKYPSYKQDGGGLEKRVFRGGCWHGSDPRELLSSFRGSNTPGTSHNRIGFRCVLLSRLS